MTPVKSSSTALRIALLPLDERPVNITLPRQIAAIGGAELLLPPRRMLPDLRQPGRTDDLGAWLEAVAGEVDAVVVSIDMLCYGGLIAGRTIWRWLANDYPIVYVPPIEVVAVLLVIPAALLVVNAIAVAPAAPLPASAPPRRSASSSRAWLRPTNPRDPRAAAVSRDRGCRRGAS